MLYKTTIKTPLGLMIAIANDTIIRLLQWHDSKKITAQLKSLSQSLIEQETDLLRTLKNQLDAYFSNTLKQFTLPLSPIGTQFQQTTWNALSKIPYRTSISYKQLALELNAPSSFRAVARANACNPIVIIIPCHRVIASSGKIHGYVGGIDRKEALLNLEGRSI